MPTFRMAIAGLVAAATTTAAPAACQKETGIAPATMSTTPDAKATPKVPGQELLPGEREWKCDMDNHAYNVNPNTAKTRADAEKSCQKMGKAIDEAPWPDGVSVVPLPPH